MAASKKWKYTLRVDKPEAKSCTLGSYLDQLGILEKSGRCSAALPSHAPLAGAQQGCDAETPSYILCEWCVSL